jgi:hypothetical protein
VYPREERVIKGILYQFWFLFSLFYFLAFFLDVALATSTCKKMGVKNGRKCNISHKKEIDSIIRIKLL